MNANSPVRDDHSVSLSFMLISSLLAGLFLFFIDEGFFDIRWMLDWGNWIAFIVYVGSFMIGQVALDGIFFKRVGGVARPLVVGLFGIGLGLLFTVKVVFHHV